MFLLPFEVRKYLKKHLDLGFDKILRNLLTESRRFGSHKNNVLPCTHNAELIREMHGSCLYEYETNSMHLEQRFGTRRTRCSSSERRFDC